MRAAEEARLRAEAEQREREEAEQRARKEAVRATEEARLRAEAEQRAREEAERQAREEAARQAEEARLRAEAEQREREEAERQAEEARVRAELARQAAEERLRRIVACTPRLTMTPGGSNREYVTINIDAGDDRLPINAELALLAPQYAASPGTAAFRDQRQDNLFEERWSKHPRGDQSLSWGTYRDAQGREFDCPDAEPSTDLVWVVISYDREVGPPASTWQQFKALGAGPLWYIAASVGEPVLIEQDEPADAGLVAEAAA